MALVLDRTDGKFAVGLHYTFDSPIQTSCIPVGGSRWREKKFVEGRCVIFEPLKNAYIFLGKSVEPSKPGEEDVPYYFYIKWGKDGATGYIPPPPHLRIVK